MSSCQTPTVAYKLTISWDFSDPLDSKFNIMIDTAIWQIQTLLNVLFDYLKRIMMVMTEH